MANQLTSTERVFMIATSFVAGLAVAVSLWQGYETRRHNRLSVKPILTFDRSYGSKTNTKKDSLYAYLNSDYVHNFRLTLKNYGTGPAIIQEFQIYKNDEKVDMTAHFPWEQAFNPDSVNITQSTWLSRGDVLREGYSTNIIQTRGLTNLHENVRLIIRYESIYEEEYTAEIYLHD